MEPIGRKNTRRLGPLAKWWFAAASLVMAKRTSSLGIGVKPLLDTMRQGGGYLSLKLSLMPLRRGCCLSVKFT
jgi:hypothetical protein